MDFEQLLYILESIAGDGDEAVDRLAAASCPVEVLTKSEAESDAGSCFYYSD